MEVKNILKLAVMFTDQKELLEDEYFLDELPQDYQESQERKDKIQTLLDCLNLVYSEVASEYLPLKTTEKVMFENNILQFSSLSKVITNVLQLKNSFGKKVKFKLFPEYIEGKITTGQLTYNFAPETLNLNSVVNLYGQKVSPRVFAYGVAMEYYFLLTQSTEALIWENRYKNALLSLVKTHHNIVLPSRRWI